MASHGASCPLSRGVAGSEAPPVISSALPQSSPPPPLVPAVSLVPLLSADGSPAGKLRVRQPSWSSCRISPSKVSFPAAPDASLALVQPAVVGLVGFHDGWLTYRRRVTNSSSLASKPLVGPAGALEKGSSSSDLPISQWALVRAKRRGKINPRPLSLASAPKPSAPFRQVAGPCPIVDEPGVQLGGAGRAASPSRVEAPRPSASGQVCMAASYASKVREGLQLLSPEAAPVFPSPRPLVSHGASAAGLSRVLDVPAP